MDVHFEPRIQPHTKELDLPLGILSIPRHDRLLDRQTFDLRKVLKIAGLFGHRAAPAVIGQLGLARVDSEVGEADIVGGERWWRGFLTWSEGTNCNRHPLSARRRLELIAKLAHQNANHLEILLDVFSGHEEVGVICIGPTDDRVFIAPSVFAVRRQSFAWWESKVRGLEFCCVLRHVVSFLSCEEQIDVSLCTWIKL